jgi:multiple RNA-binding domain-containing protein 1
MASSRIFIKGLPPNISEDEFKKHFSANATITDAKLIPHRRIGYVGYKSPEDAAKAVKYFNRSFIRMSKIGVEIARPVSLFAGMSSPVSNNYNRYPIQLYQSQEKHSENRFARVQEQLARRKLKQLLQLFSMPPRRGSVAMWTSLIPSFRSSWRLCNQPRSQRNGH